MSRTHTAGLGGCKTVSPVSLEVHLGSCVNMGPPDILFKEAEALSCDRDASQYLVPANLKAKISAAFHPLLLYYMISPTINMLSGCLRLFGIVLQMTGPSTGRTVVH